MQQKRNRELYSQFRPAVSSSSGVLEDRAIVLSSEIPWTFNRLNGPAVPCLHVFPYPTHPNPAAPTTARRSPRHISRVVHDRRPSAPISRGPFRSTRPSRVPRAAQCGAPRRAGVEECRRANPVGGSYVVRCGSTTMGCWGAGVPCDRALGGPGSERGRVRCIIDVMFPWGAAAY